MGTSEFYRVVEALPGIVDSLVIDTSGVTNPDGELRCFPGAATGSELAQVEPQLQGAMPAAPTRGRSPGRRGSPHPQRQEVRGAGEEDSHRNPSRPDAVSRDAVHNPEALAPFLWLAARRQP
jgi:acetoacetyl-CoA synthetase